MPKVERAHRNFYLYELWTPIYYREICSSLSPVLLDPSTLRKEFATSIAKLVTNHAHYTLCHTYKFLGCECLFKFIELKYHLFEN